MKKIYIILLLLCGVTANAQVKLNSENRDSAYVKSIIGRSQKIVNKLGLNDENKQQNICNIIANRYFLLNDIYERRDAAVKEAKQKLNGEDKQRAILNAENQKDSELYRNHFSFEAELSLYLDNKQIETIKDGMTYGVVMVTYQATIDMIPSLKEYEKAQILAWLKEAREFAMDAENSNKKHAAFGKYKGRINNYLSKQGYDLTKEREEWYKRMKAEGKKF